MAGEVIVDALPYIDQGYEEAGVRVAALAMVEEETRRYRPTKNYLEHLPPLNTTLFETEMMKSEWERMQQRQPMDVLSMKRYELPPPPSGKMTDIAAWTECVENSQAQLEHQATRICNLELMLEYGCEAWKSYLELLVASVSQAQKNLQALRKDIQEINWERKNAQMKGGEKLKELEDTWVSLVSKNYDIEQACVTVEEEIIRLQREKEGVLKRRRIEEERANVKRRKLEQETLQRQQVEQENEAALQLLSEQQTEREEEGREEQMHAHQEGQREQEEEETDKRQLEQLHWQQQMQEGQEVQQELEQQAADETWQRREEEEGGEEDNTTRPEESDSQSSTEYQEKSNSIQSGSAENSHDQMDENCAP